MADPATTTLPPDTPNVSPAPTHTLPKHHHYNTIELPFRIPSIPRVLSCFGGPGPSTAPVQLNTASTSSTDPPYTASPAAVRGKQNIDAVLNRQAAALELWFDPDARWSHPVQGEPVDTNRLLLRIVKRRRKRKVSHGGAHPASGMATKHPHGHDHGHGNDHGHGPTSSKSHDAMDVDEAPRFAAQHKGKGRADPPSTANGHAGLNGRSHFPTEDELHGNVGGIFKAEIVGVVQKTVRFKAMADYQYTPDPNDIVPKLVDALMNADAQSILDFRFPSLNETYYVPIEAPTPPLRYADESKLQSVPPLNGSHDAAPLAGGSGASNQAGHPAPAVGTHTENVGNAPRRTTSPAKKETPTRIWSDKDIKYRSVMNVPPPPIFSRQVVPFSFGYQANPGSRETTIKDPITGEEITRLYNAQRLRGHAMQSIKFEDNVPQGPTPDIMETEKDLDETVVALLRQKMQERPMWGRQALISQFGPTHQKILESKKTYFPLCAWTYADGPFRDNVLRYGYDPRKDPESYLYQRIYFRAIREDSGVRNVMRRMVDAGYEGGSRGTKGKDSELTRKRAAMAGEAYKVDPNKGHIFDGRILHRDVANYQLIDITDPLLHELIRHPDARKDYLDSANGWYKPKQFEAIKAILRRKWLAISEDGFCSDEDCEDLLKDFYDFDAPTSPTKLGQPAPLPLSEAGTPDATTAEQQAARNRVGRPKGGGGYAAGTVPTGTTVRADLDRKDRWKRKGVSYIPMAEVEQAARRLQRALEREQRQVRHATMRGEFHDEIAQPDPDQEGEEQEGEEVEEADAGEDAD